LTKYDELKEEFYDASVDDFTAGPLNEIAMSLAQQKNTENAIALLKFSRRERTPTRFLRAIPRLDT